MTFKLHPQLKKDCINLGEFKLCSVLLMNDRRYPWFILVPQCSDTLEIFQLSESDQLQLRKESIYLTQKLSELFNADKMNTAALGNIVPQLHIHHVVRYKDDPAWPAPIWGIGEAIKYSTDELANLHIRIKGLIAAL